MVRADLSPGLSAAQAVHAAFHYSHEHPVAMRTWIIDSNFLVIVAVPNEGALYDLITTARGKGITALGVREPDLDNEITAVVLQPGDVARRLCSAFPLALRGMAMA